MSRKITGICAVLLMIAVLAGCMPHGVTFPMQGNNVADLQPEQIMDEIAAITGIAADDIFVPDIGPQDFWLTGGFDWHQVNFIWMMFERETRRGGRIYTGQLQIGGFNDEFLVTQLQRRDDPFFQPQHRLQDFLDALKYIPQEYIRSLLEDPADSFMLQFFAGGVDTEEHAHLFYNRYGVMDEMPSEYILFSLLPMYRVENNGGRYFQVEADDANDSYDTMDSPEHHYQGSGDNAIFLFYGLA